MLAAPLDVIAINFFRLPDALFTEDSNLPAKVP
jgi:hypothetical protein